MSDYDSPWKEAIDLTFERFLAFFFPSIHAALDWTCDVEMLDTELQKLRPESETGKRRADKLVKVWCKGEGDEFAILHAEVQCQPETDFAHRQHVYNYRCEDRYLHPIVSLALLGDDDPNWRPSEYRFERWDCRRTLAFPTAKLLDWRGREPELEGHANPFALLTLAHLQSLATRNDNEGRQTWKLRLIKLLFTRGWDAEEMRQLYRFLDWLLPLPIDMDKAMWQEIDRFAKEKQVPFVTFAEKYYTELGLEKGLQSGMEKGMEKGMKRGVCSMLRIRHGEKGEALVPTIQALTDSSVLDQLLQILEQPASTLDDFQKHLPKAAGTP